MNSFLTLACLVLAGGSASGADTMPAAPVVAPALAASLPEDITTPEAALAELKAGNDRFVGGEITEEVKEGKKLVRRERMVGKRARTLSTQQDPELREKLAEGQSPFAAIVTCSDSRAMDNLIFDQELGRLFTIRVAGNTPGTIGLASIEYAVKHLGSKIVVVMGHSRCGAVGAVADSRGKPLHGHMHAFQEHMAGLLDVVVRDPNETDTEYKGRLEKENAIRQAQAVYDRSEIIREFVDNGKTMVVPAKYDLRTGKVTFFDAIEGNPNAGHEH